MQRVRFVVLAVCGALAACSGARSSAPQVPQADLVRNTQGNAARSTGRFPALAVGGRGHYFITLYDSDGSVFGRIHQQAGPMAFDEQGDLYVAPFYVYGIRDPYVRIYSPPYTGKPIGISFVKEFPRTLTALAVDEKTGVFAVVDSGGGGGVPPTRVSFFGHTQTTPCAVVALPESYSHRNYYAAFDANGVLFFTYQSQLSPYGEGLLSISGECKPSKPVIYPAPWVDGVFGIAFDSQDRLVVAKFYRALRIRAHPSNGKLGKFVHQTPLHSSDFLLALSADGKALWASEIQGESIYNYPAGGNPVKTFGNIVNTDWGAAYPALIP